MHTAYSIQGSCHVPHFNFKKHPKDLCLYLELTWWFESHFEGASETQWLKKVRTRLFENDTERGSNSLKCLLISHLDARQKESIVTKRVALGEDIELNDRVSVLQPTHPGDWLAVASCFLSTSLYEGFGLAMAEASAAGVPIVASPVGIASRPGVAITVPIDAIPVEWAKAIVASTRRELPNMELYSLDAHIAAWEEVVRI